MKNVFKALLLIMLIISISLISSCKSPDPWTDEEYFVRNAICSNLTNFKNPASVKVISAHQGNDKYVSVKISASNSYGGTVTEEYYIFTEDAYLPSGKLIARKRQMENADDLLTRLGKSYSATEFSELIDFIKQKPTKSIAYSSEAINKVLDSYKSSMGWN